MQKLIKVSGLKKIGQQFSVDSDKLQLLDECNSGWAKAWKAAAKQLSELEVQAITLAQQRRKLVGITRAKK
jgi:hypothetical protein